MGYILCDLNGMMKRAVLTKAKGLERNNLGNSDLKCVADLVGLCHETAGVAGLR